MNKTFQNKQLGFEIDVPKNWIHPLGEAIKSPFGEEIIFHCGDNEKFNIQIGESIPESLDKIEQEFRRYALGKQYIGLEFGKIVVGGTNHVWARYQMGENDWTKKYLIVVGNTEYDMTGTCFTQEMFAKREVIWDKIVESFRIIPIEKVENNTNVFDRMNQSSKVFEIGYSYFKSGDYKKALEQFEKGKMITHEFPWNFFGISMTLMQMIEMGVIPDNQIKSTVTNAEKNLEVCLLISPREQDYLDVMKIIQEFKKKNKI